MSRDRISCRVGEILSRLQAALGLSEDQNRLYAAAVSLVLSEISHWAGRTIEVEWPESLPPNFGAIGITSTEAYRGSCEICGHSRAVNVAHIVPRSRGGTSHHGNLLFLCANHHYLFDNHRLTLEEFDRIHWSRKAPDAQTYAAEARRRLEIAAEQGFPMGGPLVPMPTVCSTCGGGTFRAEIEDRPPPVDSILSRGALIKKLVCVACGEFYQDYIEKDYSWRWWHEFIAQKVIERGFLRS